jgi:hypothetical protein
MTIRGAGSVGLNISNLNNQGAILAQGDNAELLIQSTSFTNDGTLVAEGVKGMSITSSDFTTAGLVQISANSVLNRTGDYIQTDGLTNINGILNVTSLYDLQGGTLSGNGQLNGDISVSGGTVGPGNSPGLLSIDGNYLQTISGILAIELGGLIPGAEYDVLDITGSATLAGALDVELFDLGDGLFSPKLGDSFDILLAETLSGSFDTFLLAELDEGLSFDVSYLINEIGSTDVVRLSVVSSVPIPSAVWFFGSGLLGLLGMARHKRQFNYSSR